MTTTARNQRKRYDPPVSGEATCRACQKTKHVLAFSSDSKNVTGIRSVCRDCDNANAKHHRDVAKSKKSYQYTMFES